MQNEELIAIKQCQNGDLDAFATLYDNYVKRIYDFIYYRTSHKQTAEDLTSVTFTKAFQNIKSFRSDTGLFSSWLYKIARNTVIDHMRTNKPTVDLDAAVNSPAKDNVAGETELKDRLQQVKTYLNKLSEDQRDIVVMRLWDELTYAEIANVTGKSEGNCKVIFSRVMAKMQKELIPILLYLFFILNLNQ
jgi:RNA polymerase sigma factor (sigma-70 family)